MNVVNNETSPAIPIMPGRGLDVGTGFLVEASMFTDGSVSTKSVRDSFLEIKPANKLVSSTLRKTLLKTEVSFFEQDDTFFVLGDHALTQSVERQMVLRRPMSKGVISPKEAQGLVMFKALLREVLGTPAEENEKVVYSIPGKPIDAPFDIAYHESVIESILTDLGYKGSSFNEAQAIIFSELEDDDYTGIAVSMGSGMTNVSIANMADSVAEFSVSKGGDFIDESTALALGYDPKDYRAINEITPNLVTFVKEQGVNILSPDSSNKIEIGIAAHYKRLIEYVVDNIVNEIASAESVPRFTTDVPVIVAGGTSLAPGVLEVFRNELESRKSKLPFGIKEVRHSSKPMTAVAEGCLLALHAG